MVQHRKQQLKFLTQEVMLKEWTLNIDYLDKNYPGGWKFDQQTLILDEDRQYDIMAIILPDGSRKEVWFDITEFYKLE